jgi:hypothetical protein
MPTPELVMRPALLLATLVAACAFGGSALAGTRSAFTLVRFSPNTTPAQMRAAFADDEKTLDEALDYRAMAKPHEPGA